MIWGVMKTTPFHDFAFYTSMVVVDDALALMWLTMLMTTVMQIVWELRQRAVPRH